MLKAYKYKLYPTPNQVEALTLQLSECSRLYNAAIAERIGAYKIAHKSVNYYDQKKQVKEVRASGDCLIANHQVAADVIKRVDRAFQAFFRRCKSGSAPGFPRFRSYKLYDSLTFTTWDNGCRFVGKKLYVAGAGNLKIRLHRPIEGRIKTLTIKREGHQWFAIFTVECEGRPLEPTGQLVGIDVGLKSFAALSTGETIANPRWYAQVEKELRVAGRRLARRQKGSKGWNQAKDQLRAIHRKISNKRKDFQHKTSRAIVNRFDMIAVENLNIKGMAMGMLAKSVHDAGWSDFRHCLEYKSKEAGRNFLAVNAAGTSQTCICGQRVSKTLATRQHLCPTCGANEDRDIMSARIILKRALAVS